MDFRSKGCCYFEIGWTVLGMTYKNLKRQIRIDTANLKQTPVHTQLTADV